MKAGDDVARLVGALLLVSAVFFFLPGARVRQWVFALCNICFLVTQSLDEYAWALLAGFLLSGYVVGRRLARAPNRGLLIGYLAVVTVTFVVVKQYSFATAVLPPWVFSRHILLVGLSYMLFRQIHFIVDAQQGQIEAPSLWSYLNYQLNVFGLQAGPIQRQEFVRAAIRRCGRYTQSVCAGGFGGVIKVLRCRRYVYGPQSHSQDRRRIGVGQAGAVHCGLSLFRHTCI